MKTKTLMFALFSVLFKTTSAQITYFHYFDYTSRWDMRLEGIYSGPCGNDFAVYRTYITFYMDGDTMISGNWYYKLESTRIDSTFCPGSVTVDTSHSSTLPLREDAQNKVYKYPYFGTSEEVLWDYNLLVGGTISTGCTIASIDTVWLGAMSLKRFHCGCGTFVIEGVGSEHSLFDLYCGIGIEANSFLVCYQKQNDQVQVTQGYSCGLIPLSTSQNYLQKDNIVIYPNPTNGLIHLNTLGNSDSIIRVWNMLGNVVTVYNINEQQTTIDLSKLYSGVYFIEFMNSGTRVMRKVVKE